MTSHTLGGPTAAVQLLPVPLHVLDLPCSEDVRTAILSNLAGVVIQRCGQPYLAFKTTAEVELARRRREELMYPPPRTDIADLVGRPVPTRLPNSAQPTRYAMPTKKISKAQQILTAQAAVTAAFLAVTDGPTGPLWTGPGMLVVLDERHLDAQPVENRWPGYDLPLGSTLTVDEALELTRKEIGPLFDAQFVLLPDRRLTLAFKHPAVQAWGREELAQLRAPEPVHPYTKPGDLVLHCDRCARAFTEDDECIEYQDEVYCQPCAELLISDDRAYQELEEKAMSLVRGHLARYGRGRRIREVVGRDGDWLLDHFRTAITRLMEDELYGAADEEHITGQAADD